MARLGLRISAAIACIGSIPFCFSACGLGSDMDVGDDQEKVTPSSGGAKGSGGNNATGGHTATGGSPVVTGGVTAAGGSVATGGVRLTGIEGGAPGGATAAGGKPAAGGGSGSGGLRIIPCGKNTCGAGQYCCNPSCGTCAGLNELCTQEACEDPPTGVPCGNTVCGAGEYCCNPSCSTCAQKTGGCTQQVCEPTTACTINADCRVEADYCTGCNCRALPSGEKLPACPGPGLQCLIDPCDGKASVCKGGKCVVQ
jgi:hypothetical protein